MNFRSCSQVSDGMPLTIDVSDVLDTEIRRDAEFFVIEKNGAEINMFVKETETH